MSPSAPKRECARPSAIVIEPSDVLSSVLVRVLEERGREVLCCSDVLSALEAISIHMPSIVITSIELPGFSGHTLVAALKCDPVYRSLPICVITSLDTTTRNSNRYRPDVILKKGPQLQEALGKFLDSIHLMDSSSAPRDLQDKIHGMVLLAEDSRVSQLLYSRILHVAGAKVVAVDNGAEALEAIDRHKFDLILMDIEMPEITVARRPRPCVREAS